MTRSINSLTSKTQFETNTLTKLVMFRIYVLTIRILWYEKNVKLKCEYFWVMVSDNLFLSLKDQDFKLWSYAHFTNIFYQPKSAKQGLNFSTVYDLNALVNILSSFDKSIP